MALQLPYPNMDFVPLDILTAQEQDQLVANIEYIAQQFPVPGEYIADGAISTAKIASNAVQSDNINWITIVKQNVSNSPTDNYGCIDFGNVRVQWKTAQITNLNTGAGGYNLWNMTLPAPMKDANYTVVCDATTDVGQVAGGEFKAHSRTTTTVGLNYNHTGAIGSSNMTYSVVVIGMKP